MPADNLPDAAQTGQAAGGLIYWIIGCISAAILAIQQATRKPAISPREEVETRSTTIELVDTSVLGKGLQRVYDVETSMSARLDEVSRQCADLLKKLDDVYEGVRRLETEAAIERRAEEKAAGLVAHRGARDG